MGQPEHGKQNMPCSVSRKVVKLAMWTALVHYPTSDTDISTKRTLLEIERLCHSPVLSSAAMLKPRPLVGAVGVD